MDLDENSALRELLSVQDLYGQEPKHLASFNFDMIKIFKRKLKPRDARALCPPAALGYMTHFQTQIEKTEIELEEMRDSNATFKPYWDPQLRRRSEVLRVVKALWELGLMTFRSRMKGRVGMFTVKKKVSADGTPWQRLIIDARQANACHRPPPTTNLAGAGGMVELDLSDGYLKDAGFGALSTHRPMGNEGDVGDCFYNFLIPELASWFCIEEAIPVHELRALGIEINSVYDDDMRGPVPVHTHQLLYPASEAMAMGWSWALYFANEIITHRVALSRGSWPGDAMRERRPCPQVGLSRPVTGVYVDNVRVIGGRPADVDGRMNGIICRFKDLEIPFDVQHTTASIVLEALGLVYDFKDRTLRHTSRRMWRLYLATCAFLRRSRVSGDQMQIWLGHVVNHFQLEKSCLSCLSACYRFVEVAGPKRRQVWDAVRFEIRLVLGLIMQIEVLLAAPFCREVTCGDSSGFGYAVLTTLADDQDIRDAYRWRERWRFLRVALRGGRPWIGPAERDFLGGLSSEGDIELAMDHAAPDEVRPGVRVAGCGTSTAFGQWLAARPAPKLERRRGLVSRRPRPGQTEILVQPGIPPLSSRWDDRSRYQIVIRGRWRWEQEHINVKEGRVVLMSVRRACRVKKNLRRKHLTLSDNMSCLGAFEKGRSASYGLNNLCRRLCAYKVGGQIQLRC